MRYGCEGSRLFKIRNPRALARTTALSDSLAFDDLKQRHPKSNHNLKTLGYFNKVLTCWNTSESMFAVSFPVLVFC